MKNQITIILFKRWPTNRFSKAKSYNNFHFHKNDVTWSLSANGLLKIWFKTDLGPENSASYYRQGRQLLLTLLSMATRWSRSTSIFYALIGQIWQVSSCGKFMQHLESCLPGQLKLTEFCVNLWCFKLSFSTGCTKWNSATIRSLLLFMASWFLVEKVERSLCSYVVYARL